jgi:hypothetical protein
MVSYIKGDIKNPTLGLKKNNLLTTNDLNKLTDHTLTA